MTPPEAPPPLPAPQPPDPQLSTPESRPLSFAPASSPVTQGKLPAGFWLRCWARLADTMVINFVFSLFAVALAVGHAQGLSGSLTFILLLLSSLLPALAYYSYYQSGGRQSLGYYLAGIQVLNEQGQPLRWLRSGGRALLTWGFLGFAGCGIGLADYAALAFSRDKRALHDMLTSTYVARIALPKTAALAICCVLGFLPVLAIKKSLFPFQAFYIPAGSMEPTFRINDRLLVNRLCYRLREPRSDDLVIFRAPPVALQMSGGAPGSDIDFTKRCIGTPGDVVEMRGRQCYRNGQALREPYIKWDANMADTPVSAYDMKIVEGRVYSRDYVGTGTHGEWSLDGEPAPDQAKITRAPPGKVPPGQFLMLGDHRSNSLDSHFWGFVPRANLVGRVMVIFWPLSRAKGF